MAKHRKAKPPTADVAESALVTAGVLEQTPLGAVDVTPNRRRQKHSSPNLADERIVGPDQLLDRIPLDRSTIYRMVQEGRFPAPIRLTASGSRIGWRWSAVLRWLTERETDPVAARTFFGRDKDKPTETA